MRHITSSPTTIVLYNKMYMCEVFPSNRKKLKKRKCDLHEISFASPKAVVLKLVGGTEPSMFLAGTHRTLP